MTEALSERLERRESLKRQLAEIEAAKNLPGVPASLHDSTMAELRADIAVYDIVITAMQKSQKP